MDIMVKVATGDGTTSSPSRAFESDVRLNSQRLTGSFIGAVHIIPDEVSPALLFTNKAFVHSTFPSPNTSKAELEDRNCPSVYTDPHRSVLC